MRVTVVDSGSPDGDAGHGRARVPGGAAASASGNIGFSAANNLALRESEAGAVLLLNPDTEVYAGTLDAALARLLERGRGSGWSAVKLVTESRRARPRLQALLPHPAQRPRPLHRDRPRAKAPSGALSQYRATDLGDDEPGEVDAVNGAFMLCRAEAVREVGLLDEGYWLYMEDLDWCRRFWDAGWKVFYEPAGAALHVKGGSSGGRRAPRQEIAFHRGMGRFYRRFDAPGHSPPAQRGRLRRHRRQTGRQPGDHRGVRRR